MKPAKKATTTRRNHAITALKAITIFASVAYVCLLITQLSDFI